MAIHLKLPFTHLLFLILSCIVSRVARSELSPPYQLQPQDFQNDRLYRTYRVIQRFKSTITSDPKNVTATWTGNDICGESSYLGFYCEQPLGQDKDFTVTAVLLNGFHLRAPKLQGFIDQLPDLAIFHASSNEIGGDIPHLDSLPYQFEFSVASPEPLHPFGSSVSVTAGASAGSNNKGRQSSLEGTRAGSSDNTFFNFTIHLQFGSPNGGGAIPGVTDAKALLLNYNNLSGPLPANLGFSKFSYLALANNKLTGPIPPSIAHMQDSLFEVLLLNNQLSGCLPHELGMLTKTSVIDAGMNQLTGPIPSSFSCLSSVEQLNLAGNRLYGQVPDALCNLAGPAGRLANLTLSSNYFTSVGPACSALIKDGVLDVKRNCIPGFANQRGPAECASFLSQPKTCPASSAPVACPTATDAKKDAAAPEGTVTRDYSSYVTYATLHE
ncbi:hypothetical protein ACQ4PT_044079 [Festuca glaucescens]